MHPGNTLEQERDGRGVALLAGFLEISEFEVFAEAFRAYYRRDAGLPDLERHFGSYLRDGQVPFWVRDFVRKRLDALGIDTRRGEVAVGAGLGLALDLLAPGLRTWLGRQGRAADLLA